MRFVDNTGEEIDQAAYDSWVIQNYLDSQGNGQGSLA
jgi:hypothetical protein